MLKDMYGEPGTPQPATRKRALILEATSPFGIALTEHLDAAGVSVTPAELADTINGPFDLVVAAADSTFDTSAKGVEHLIAHMAGVAQQVAGVAHAVDANTVIVLAAQRNTPMDNSKVHAWMNNAVKNLRDKAGCRAAAIICPDDGPAVATIGSLIAVGDNPGTSTMVIATSAAAAPSEQLVDRATVDTFAQQAAEKLSDAARAEEWERTASKTMEEVRGKVGAANDELARKTAELDTVKNDVEQAKAELVELRKATQDLRTQSADLETRLAAGRAAEPEAREAIEHLNRMNAQIAEVRKEAEELAGNLAAMRAERETAGVELAAERARAADAQDRADRASHDATNAEVELLNVSNRVEAILSAAHVDATRTVAEADKAASERLEDARREASATVEAADEKNMEADRRLTEAENAAAQIRTEAQSHAETLVADAEQKAADLHEAARVAVDVAAHEAEATIAAARDAAEQMRAEAAAAAHDMLAAAEKERDDRIAAAQDAATKIRQAVIDAAHDRANHEEYVATGKKRNGRRKGR